MARPITYTETERQAILDAYNDRSRTLEDIAKEFEIDRGAIDRIVMKAGVPKRRPRKNTAVKTCPKCHKRIEVKDAKFCYFCGADIRSEKELLIERIHSAMRKTMLCPENVRDEFQRLFMDIKAELSKEVPV